MSVAFKHAWQVLRSAVVVYASFIVSITVGKALNLPEINMNTWSQVSAASPPELVESVIDEGRRQLDRQAERFNQTTGRGQAIVTVGLAVIAFAAATFNGATGSHGPRGVGAMTTWILGFVMAVLGALGGGSVVVAKATFAGVDTTQMSNWTFPPGATETPKSKLANEYAQAVIVGEDTVAYRISMLRYATRVLLFGALLIAIARLLTN